MNRDEIENYITFNEGYRTHVYNDSEGNPTIGIGFNLNRSGARAAIEGVGANYDNVRNGSQELNYTQIDTLFQADVNSAIEIARDTFSDVDNFTDGRKTVATDLAFSMGAATLGGFVHFIAAANSGDWSTAADELQDSEWFGQVGQRGVRNVNAVRSGASPTGSDHMPPDAKAGKDGKDGSDKAGDGKHGKEGDDKHGKESTDKHGKEGDDKHGKESTDKHGKEGDDKHGKESTDKHGKESTDKHGKESTDKHGKEGMDMP